MSIVSIRPNEPFWQQDLGSKLYHSPGWLAWRVEARCGIAVRSKKSAFVARPRDYGETIYALRYAASEDWNVSTNWQD